MKTTIYKTLLLILFACHTSIAQLAYLKDSKKNIAVENIPIHKFVPLQSGQFSIGEDSSYHWFKIEVQKSDIKNFRRFIEINSPWLDSLWIYDKNMRLLTNLSWKTPLTQRPFPHQNFILPIDLRNRSNEIFYIKIHRKQMVIIGGISIRNESEFYRKRKLEGSYLGYFSGILLFVTIFSVLMFVNNRERIYLIYGIYAFSHWLLVLTLYANHLNFYQPSFLKIPAFQVGEFFSLIVHLSIFLFVKAFLFGTKSLSAVGLFVWKSTLIVIAFVFLFKILFVTLYNYGIDPPNWLLLLTALGFLRSVLASFAIIFLALYSKYNLKAVNIYLLGISPLGIFAIFTYLRNMRLIEHSVWLEMEGHVLVVLWDILVLTVALAYRYKILRDEKEELLKENNQNQELAYKIGQSLQNQERIRLAKELHDGLGIDISLVKMKLEALKMDLTEKGMSSESFDLVEVVKNMDSVAAEIRSFSHNLMPPDLENLGIVNVLQNLLNSLQNLNPNIEINFTSNITQKLDDDLSQNLFFIAKELINNAFRHSNASIIDVELIKEKNRTELKVSDNGIGYDFGKSIKKEGLGLESIKSRVALINAKLELSKKTSGGISNKIVYTENTLKV